MKQTMEPLLQSQYKSNYHFKNYKNALNKK
jgi:hypothetical protein